MTQSDQSPKAQALDDDDLDTLSGGFEAWPAKWDGFSLNGKGNSASITVDQKTIIGGFKSMGGMGSATVSDAVGAPTDGLKS